MKAQVAKAEVAGGWKVAIPLQFLFLLLITPVSVFYTMSFRLVVSFLFRAQAGNTALTAVDVSRPGKMKDSLESQESRDWNKEVFLCMI